MRILNCAGNCADRAFSGAKRTAFAEFGNDLIFHEILTYVSRTSLVYNVSDVFVAEEFHCGKYGVGRCLTERAERSGFDVFAELFKLVDVFERTVSVGDLFEGFEKTNGTDTAGNTFTAGFVNGEFKEEFRNVNHAVVFVHND